MMTLKPVEVRVPITELHYVGWVKIKTKGHRHQTRTDVITPLLPSLNINAHTCHMKRILFQHLMRLIWINISTSQDLLDKINFASTVNWKKKNHPQHFHKFIEQFLNYCMKILSKCNVEEKIYCTCLTQRYRSVEPPSCSAYSWLILRSSSYSLSINSWRLPSCRATSISSCGALMQLFILWKRKEKSHTTFISFSQNFLSNIFL